MHDTLGAFATQELASPKELSEYSKVGWIFRGQEKAWWGLETSLERCCSRHDVAVNDRALVEYELFREFRRAYHEYSVHVPNSDSIIEWISLMQHYGAPTRLLDFTYSVHVAAYFAVETATEDSAIWAVNAQWALTQSLEALRSLNKHKEDVDKLEIPFVEGTEAVVENLLFRAPNARMTCPINPFRLNERLRIQKGVFLIPGSIEVSLLENLTAMAGHEKRENVLRLVIPARLAQDVRACLFDMNITRRSLFPGLDGYAQALGVYHPVFNPNEPHRKRLEKLRALGGMGGLINH